jgi:hypothetical protein
MAKNTIFQWFGPKPTQSNDLAREHDEHSAPLDPTPSDVAAGDNNDDMEVEDAIILEESGSADSDRDEVDGGSEDDVDIVTAIEVLVALLSPALRLDF